MPTRDAVAAQNYKGLPGGFVMTAASVGPDFVYGRCEVRGCYSTDPVPESRTSDVEDLLDEHLRSVHAQG